MVEDRLVYAIPCGIDYIAYLTDKDGFYMQHTRFRQHWRIRASTGDRPGVEDQIVEVVDQVLVRQRRDMPASLSSTYDQGKSSQVWLAAKHGSSGCHSCTQYEKTGGRHGSE